jgi:serine/threonine-protein kinase
LTFLACTGTDPAPGDTAAAADAEFVWPASENPDAQAAFDAGREFWERPGSTPEDTDSSVTSLQRAIELDPEFVSPLIYLTGVQAYTHQMFDRSPLRRQIAFDAAHKAVELDPEYYGTHWALGDAYYRIDKDFDRALESYDRALEMSPDDASLVARTAYVLRRAGRWDEALERLVQADEMDDGTVGILELGNTYRNLGRYDEAEAAYRRLLEINPDATSPPSVLAWIPVYRDGDTGPLRAFLESRASGYVSARWNLEMFDEDGEAALAVLEEGTIDPFLGQYGVMPRSLMRAFSHQLMGNETEALASFEEAATTMTAMVAEREEDPRMHVALGQALAGLGSCEEAIAHGRKALELMPAEKDAMIGPWNHAGLASILTQCGEHDLAVEELTRAFALPSTFTPKLALLRSDFAPLRDHPGFQALCGG